MTRALDRSGRSPGAARLLAVTKGISADLAMEAVGLGVTDLGESRIQEAEPKIGIVGVGPRWHLVGHLQTNKAKRAVALFDEIHSIDSERLAQEVARRAAELGRSPVVYVEVNTSGDAAKHGIPPEGAMELTELVASLPPLLLVGFMTIGPLTGGAEGARQAFRRLRGIRDDAAARGLLPADGGLSMGMSDDFEIAIEEGATIVRVGSALFGTGGTGGTGGPRGMDSGAAPE